MSRAAVLSAAMMLKYSFGLDRECEAIESAVRTVLKEGYRTIDIMPQNGSGECTQVGTSKIGTLIAERV